MLSSGKAPSFEARTHNERTDNRAGCTRSRSSAMASLAETEYKWMIPQINAMIFNRESWHLLARCALLRFLRVHVPYLPYFWQLAPVVQNAFMQARFRNQCKVFCSLSSWLKRANTAPNDISWPRFCMEAADFHTFPASPYSAAALDCVALLAHEHQPPRVAVRLRRPRPPHGRGEGRWRRRQPRVLRRGRERRVGVEYRWLLG